jgi:hypothetical protein
MGAQGTTTIDFGAFPGASHVSIAITDTSILDTSLCEAWIRPEASADHTFDEHLVETIKFHAFGIDGFDALVIHAFNSGTINEPVYDPKGNYSPGPADAQTYDRGGKGTRIWGVWNVQWCWN